MEEGKRLTWFCTNMLNLLCIFKLFDFFIMIFNLLLLLLLLQLGFHPVAVVLH